MLVLPFAIRCVNSNENIGLNMRVFWFKIKWLLMGVEKEKNVASKTFEKRFITWPSVQKILSHDRVNLNHDIGAILKRPL